MILVVDNYDSFTYNLVQYIGLSGAEVRVFRNDELSVAEVLAIAPEKIVISPGLELLTKPAYRLTSSMQ